MRKLEMVSIFTHHFNQSSHFIIRVLYCTIHIIQILGIPVLVKNRVKGSKIGQNKRNPKSSKPALIERLIPQNNRKQVIEVL